MFELIDVDGQQKCNNCYEKNRNYLRNDLEPGTKIIVARTKATTAVKIDKKTGRLRKGTCSTRFKSKNSTPASSGGPATFCEKSILQGFLLSNRRYWLSMRFQLWRFLHRKSWACWFVLREIGGNYVADTNANERQRPRSQHLFNWTRWTPATFILMFSPLNKFKPNGHNKLICLADNFVT